MKAPAVTSKSQAVRQVLTQAARPLNIDELHARIERKLKQVIGRQNLYQLLSVMQAAREIESMGRPPNRFYNLRKAVTK